MKKLSISRIIRLFSALLILVSLSGIFSQKLTESEEREEVTSLRETHEEAGDQELTRKNPDYYGWLRIPGTGIDYPVMFREKDNSFYLTHNFEGEQSAAGTPFLDGLTEDDSNLILYGHHLSNGEGFTGIISYSDQDFSEEHPEIILTREGVTHIYRVLTAFYTHIPNSDRDSVFRYYEYTSLKDPERRAGYIENILRQGLYRTGAELKESSKFIMLSTCEYSTENGRFVLVGVES